MEGAYRLHSGPVRWDELFDDLDGQYDAAVQAELADEVRDRTRREAALLSLADRLASAVGAALRLTVTGAGPLSGRLTAVGPDWLLLHECGGESLVPLAAVVGLSGAGARSRAPGGHGEVARRLDLRWALRGLARQRAGVQVVRVDGSVVAGTLDRVGADHLDVAEHPAGEPRRAGAVSRVQLIPLLAVAVVRSGPSPS